MRIVTFILFICVLKAKVFAQAPLVKWGDELAHGRMDKVFPISNGQFIAIKTDGSFLEEITSNYTTRISVFQDAKEIKTIELTKEFRGNKLRYEGITRLQNKLVVFFSQKEKNRCTVYQQIFSESLEPTALVEIMAYDEPKAFIAENDIYVIESENNRFVSVFFTMEDFKKDALSFGYVVLSDSTTHFYSGKQQVAMDPNQLTFGAHLLSNTGELFLSFNEKESPSRKKRMSNLLSNLRIGPFSVNPFGTPYVLEQMDDVDAIKKIHVYKCAQNQVTTLSHTLGITTINPYKMFADSSGNLVLVGSFMRFKNNKKINRSELSMNGMFSIGLDLQNWRITQEKYVDVPLNVYTYGLSDRKKNRMETSYSQGNLLPKLYDYRWKNATVLPNGDVVGHLEQIIRNVTYTSTNNSFGMGYGTTIGGYSPYASTTANVTYYFKDVLIFCMKPDGTFRWMKKVQKIQASTSYDAAYVSCFSFVNNQKYAILFSDNAKNYANNGVFLSDKKVHSNPFLAKNNIVSIVQIDMLSGETKREQFLPKIDELGAYVTRDFSYNPMNQTLFLVLNTGILGNKIRLGSLQINAIR